MKSATFGHSYASPTLNQKGGREQTFPAMMTSLAAPSQLAVDPGTGSTFYTQSTEPKTGVETLLSSPFTPLSAFHDDAEIKYRPDVQRVWIVMVY